MPCFQLLFWGQARSPAAWAPSSHNCVFGMKRPALPPRELFIMQMCRQQFPIFQVLFLRAALCFPFAGPRKNLCAARGQGGAAAPRGARGGVRTGGLLARRPLPDETSRAPLACLATRRAFADRARLGVRKRSDTYLGEHFWLRLSPVEGSRVRGELSGTAPEGRRVQRERSARAAAAATGIGLELQSRPRSPPTRTLPFPSSPAAGGTQPRSAPGARGVLRDAGFRRRAAGAAARAPGPRRPAAPLRGRLSAPRSDRRGGPAGDDWQARRFLRRIVRRAARPGGCCDVTRQGWRAGTRSRRRAPGRRLHPHTLGWTGRSSHSWAVAHGIPEGNATLQP